MDYWNRTLKEHSLADRVSVKPLFLSRDSLAIGGGGVAPGSVGSATSFLRHCVLVSLMMASQWIVARVDTH